jgi:hypothetical protein
MYTGSRSSAPFLITIEEFFSKKLIYASQSISNIGFLLDLDKIAGSISNNSFKLMIRSRI